MGRGNVLALQAAAHAWGCGPAVVCAHAQDQAWEQRRQHTHRGPVACLRTVLNATVLGRQTKLAGATTEGAAKVAGAP